MMLFAHHLGIELFGREFAPETPMEHALAFGLTAIFLLFSAYGIYAAARDCRRWLYSRRIGKVTG